MNVYYTAREGRRNANGHTTTRGEVYIIHRGDDTTRHGEDELEMIGEYVHQSGGADITLALLTVCEKHGIETYGGYYGRNTGSESKRHWNEAVHFVQI